MVCPKCGLEIEDALVCSACGWTKETDNENLEKETEVDFEALENLSVDLEENQTIIEDESEFVTKEEDLVIDFDQINGQTTVKHKNQSSSWFVSLVSFVAGVLATLIAIGCVNGTITFYLDKITNGTPYETIEIFSKFYYQTGVTADDVVEISSPYFRNQLVNEMKHYGVGEKINLDINVFNDSEYKNIVEYHIDYFKDQSKQNIKIKEISFEDLKYIKSDSEDYKSLIDYYKASEKPQVAKAEGVSMFASVSFKLSLDVSEKEQENLIPAVTTKKNKKNNNKQEVTTQSTTSAPKTSVQSVEVSGVAICVKVNDKWCVFNGMQV